MKTRILAFIKNFLSQGKIAEAFFASYAAGGLILFIYMIYLNFLHMYPEETIKILPPKDVFEYALSLSVVITNIVALLFSGVKCRFRSLFLLILPTIAGVVVGSGLGIITLLAVPLVFFSFFLFAFIGWGIIILRLLKKVPNIVKIAKIVLIFAVIFAAVLFFWHPPHLNLEGEYYLGLNILVCIQLSTSAGAYYGLDRGFY